MGIGKLRVRKHPLQFHVLEGTHALGFKPEGFCAGKLGQGGSGTFEGCCVALLVAPRKYRPRESERFERGHFKCGDNRHRFAFDGDNDDQRTLHEMEIPGENTLEVRSGHEGNRLQTFAPHHFHKGLNSLIAHHKPRNQKSCDRDW